VERRILINYRVRQDVLADMLPAPFRVLAVDGYAIAGICLIRLGAIRPAGLPAAVGLRTENAAHRVAVEWDTADGPVAGVYIPRRDTNSGLTALLGGRLFPGWHHRARFAVAEGDGHIRIQMDARDGSAAIAVRARLADRLPSASVFSNIDAASRFFSCAPVGYSVRSDGQGFDGVELGCVGWNFQPLTVDELASSYFDDASRFPPGTVTFDSAFLMRDLNSTWSPLPRRVAGDGWE
jgi:hypothetical protein